MPKSTGRMKRVSHHDGSHASVRYLIGAVLLALMASSMTGCEALQTALSQMDKPSASISGVKLQSLDLRGATLLFDVEVKNPYGVALPLGNLDYALASRDQQFLSGQVQVDGPIPARASRHVSLPASVSFAELLNVLQGVRPGAVVPYKASMNLSVDAPTVGPLKLPIEKEGELPIPTVPAVELGAVQWKDLSWSRAEAALQFKITNQNEFPVNLTNMKYALSLGGTAVADASVRNPGDFKPGQAQTVEVPIVIRPADLGMAAFRMLTGQGAGYSLAGSMALDTPFGALDVPFKREGNTVFKH